MIIRESDSETIEIRGIAYHVRHWGRDSGPKLFLLHGWMDSSATFQFVVDAFREKWHVIAPDWRGHGASEWLGRPYWFPDYYADLEAILDHYSPDQAVRLVGHSMGANIAATYAGIRPTRVHQLAMLDFLGLKPPADEQSVDLIRRWLDAQDKSPALKPHPDHASFAARLIDANPRLTRERAEFLSKAVSRIDAQGKVGLSCDPWHKVASPFRYRIEDAMSAWRSIAAPVLMLIADHGFVEQRFGGSPEEFQRRTACFANLAIERIHDAGHNLQHDQPEQTARCLERFLISGVS